MEPIEDLDSAALSSLFDNSSDLLAIADFQGNWLKVSRSWSDVLGWTDEEVKSSVFPELVHPDDVAPTVETNRQVRREGLSVVRFDNRYRRRDGSYQWLRWTGTSDADAGLIYAIGHPMSDDEKEFGRQGGDARTAKALMGMVGSCVIWLDKFGDMTSFNSGSEQMFEYSAKQLLEQPLAMLVAGTGRDTIEEAIGRAVSGANSEEANLNALQVTGLAASGRTFPVAITLNDCGPTSPYLIALVQKLGIGSIPKIPRQADSSQRHDSGVESPPTEQEPQIPLRLSGEGTLVADLQRALKNDEFLAHYQPVVTVDGDFVGMEALLRWQSPGKPTRSAFEFIDEAERSGLIGDLGMVTIEAGIRDTAELIRENRWPEGGTCAVNLSGFQLADGGLLAKIERLLSEHGVAGSTFAFEVTEHVVIHRNGQALETLDGLRTLGCQILL
ncbi:MAG: EAL domain-containing protein, partial [Actinobacteria bacterium]|nr:EAL domain-containing protein [Actinomycetota bacterium]